MDAILRAEGLKKTFHLSKKQQKLQKTDKKVITAACVAMSGLIGWVGLVIPHFCRMLFGHDNRYVIPASLIMGASYLLIVDTVSRIIATTEVPIGILTSVIGAPVFIYLMLSRRSRKE